LERGVAAAGKNILEEILSRTRADLAARRARVPLVDLQAACREAPPARDFLTGVRRDGEGRARRGAIRVIAELKRASPSRGVIRADYAPTALARAYVAGGANAISVLTDTPFFQGSLADLAAVRRAVDCPVLRKDFLVDPYQVWEARAAGADAVLLIAAALPDSALPRLLGLAQELGLEGLVEVHGPEELERAVHTGAKLIGINNRDLRTFTVSLEATFALLPQVPSEVVLVSESGIHRPEDVARLAGAGVDAILVGEGLLRHADVAGALRRLRASA
jgi:indole-3-glycerol phosphate synthase